MLDSLYDRLETIEPTISAVVGLLTLALALWGALELTLLSRRNKRSGDTGQSRPVGQDSGQRTSADYSRRSDARHPRTPLRRLMNLGVSGHSRLEELVSVRAVNIALFCIGGISLPWLMLSLLSTNTVALSVINLTVFVCVLIGFALQWAGNTGGARWLVIAAATVYWLGAMVAVGPMAGTEYFFAGLIMLPVLIFSRAQRVQMFLAILGMSAVFVLGVWLSHRLPPLLVLPQPLVASGYHSNALFLGLAIFLSVRYYKAFAASSYQQLERQKEKNEALVSSLLPERIVRQIGAHEDSGSMAEWHPEATVLFASLGGFSQLYARMPAIELVHHLSTVYSRFDGLASRHGLEKIKTLGTSYVAAAGMGGVGGDHLAVARCALDMQSEVARFAAAGGLPLSFRCGIATGLAISGVIAETHPRFDIWGEALELAMRLSEKRPEGAICVNETAFWRLKHSFELCEFPGEPAVYQLIRESKLSEPAAPVPDHT